MVKSRTKLLDRVLAVTLAVIMLIAMVPMSTITAFALSFEAGAIAKRQIAVANYNGLIIPRKMVSTILSAIMMSAFAVTLRMHIWFIPKVMVMPIA